MPEGIAVGKADGDADVPGNPASLCGLAGVIGASAELLPLAPHAASVKVPAAAAAVAAAHQRRFQVRACLIAMRLP
jgi:hypothetical protein